MREYLSCAMDIGEQMLISGAEVHRAEESIRRMCTAFGAERVDIFIITSSMNGRKEIATSAMNLALLLIYSLHSYHNTCDIT